MRRLIPCLLAVCVLGSSNLHLAVLQVVAWSSMLVTYSQDRSIAEAAEMTFDGEHPCPLCCAITKAKKTPANTLRAPASQEAPTLYLEGSQPPVIVLSPSDQHECCVRPLAVMMQSPPVPPPRRTV